MRSQEELATYSTENKLFVIDTENADIRFDQLEEYLQFNVKGRPWREHFRKSTYQGRVMYDSDWIGEALWNLAVSFPIYLELADFDKFTKDEKDNALSAGVGEIKRHLCRKGELKIRNAAGLAENIALALRDFGVAISKAKDAVERDRFPMPHELGITNRAISLGEGHKINKVDVSQLRELLQDEAEAVLFENTTGDQDQIFALLLQAFRRQGDELHEMTTSKERFLEALGYKEGTNIHRTSKRVLADLEYLSSNRFTAIKKGKGGAYITATFNLFQFDTIEAEKDGRYTSSVWSFRGFNPMLFRTKPEKHGFLDVSMTPMKKITECEDPRTAGRLKKMVLLVQTQKAYLKDVEFYMTDKELGLTKADVPKLEQRNRLKEKLVTYVRFAGAIATREGRGFRFRPEQAELGLENPLIEE